MTSTQPRRISVPLSKDAHRLAETFAAEQATPDKGKQVYLNTLAVYAVHSYLQWLMIETDFNQSDSWQSGFRTLFNIADLVISNVGKIECLPVLPDAVALELPLEVTYDRIGYVAVQFNQQLDSVQLLGFAPPVTTDELPQQLQLAQLQPLEVLIETIDRISIKQIQNTLGEPLLVNLRQWLEGIFNQDWQPTGLVLASSFRNISSTTNSVSRAKEIYLAGQWLVLVVQLLPELPQVDIRLRLYPGGDAVCLPENLQIILFDETGCACIEAQAKRTDNWMELEFSCQPRERFSVKVVLGRTSLTEKFVV